MFITVVENGADNRVLSNWQYYNMTYEIITIETFELYGLLLTLPSVDILIPWVGNLSEDSLHSLQSETVNNNIKESNRSVKKWERSLEYKVRLSISKFTLCHDSILPLNDNTIHSRHRYMYQQGI